jgi:cell division septum initiation protein DivIVA
LEKLSTTIQRLELPKIKVLGKFAGYERAAVELNLFKIKEMAEELEQRNEELEEQLNILNEEIKMGQVPSATGPTEEAEELKRKMNQLETLERSYKRMIYMAEQEAEEIKREARIKADKIEKAAYEKAESLTKEANLHFEEKAQEADDIFRKAEEVKKRLTSVAEYIASEDVI